ncbi:MAG: hypothetical protein M1818_007728 [Claussenomyces sp. TS43310]|nr:MAG: hypothetical protein M1818_007728 [Claussenomyces sp. TS43310]
MSRRLRGLREDYLKEAHETRAPCEPQIRIVPGVEPEQFVPVLKAHIRKTYEPAFADTQPWRLLPEIPSSGELMDESDKSVEEESHQTEKTQHTISHALPHNIVDGEWPDKEPYVQAHYSLLREDVVAPLRNAVALFRAHPDMKDDRDVAIYDHIHIVGYTFSHQGPAFRVDFSYERAGKRIRWRQSKRLQQGTLVALTPRLDRFSTVCRVAVVAARPLAGLESNPPQIDLFWADSSIAEIDPTEAWTMIEARSGYFEANRHMLVAMQKLMSESFPMAEQLVKLNKLVSAPDFLKLQSLTNLNSLVGDSPLTDGFVDDGTLDNVDILADWPNIEGTKLDDSQLAALRRILTKQLAIVQGPPGTGKTFVSISALIVMLQNWASGDPPILVAAQTNHALDQLLMLVERVEPNFVRLGGRTEKKNGVIKQRTLYEIRLKAPNAAKPPYFNYKNAKKALDDHANQLQKDIQRAIAQPVDEAQLFRDLELITLDQFNSLSDDDWTCAQDDMLPPGVMASWLGREQLTTTIPRCPPINMGFPEEEIDPDFENLNEDELEFDKDYDDEMDTLRGTWYPYNEAWAGKPALGWSAKKIKRLLEKTGDLWDIPEHVRGEVYQYLRRLLKQKMLEAFRVHLDAYLHSCQSLKLSRWQSDATMIKRLGVKLIGCTTTGLSKYRGLLASLEPRTLLIEEAAETTEGTILAAMFESIQQLILVGDHQQLQAQCNMKELSAAPYHLSVSMFERLVNNGIEYTMLNTQRRMIPEVRQLLNPFYPALKDHPSVRDRLINRKPVPGMGGRDTYFFHHHWPESQDETASRSNIDEAEMIVKFFCYLVLNAVGAAKITVLTFYNGQRKKILNMLQKESLLDSTKSFNVFTVDSYQGEENDIILLSLVRSNESSTIGFLENRNRAVVSLSRARRGLYIFGNAKNLISANPRSFELWGSVTDTFQKFGRLNIDSGLPIVCQNHQLETIINEPHEWHNVTGGFSLTNPLSAKNPAHGFSLAVMVAMNIVDKHEIWPVSLDEVLGDQSPKKTSSIQSIASSRPSQEIFTAVNIESGDRWRAWDAAEADQQLANAYALEQETIEPNLPRKTVFKEIHRAIVVKNGTRIYNETITTVRKTDDMDRAPRETAKIGSLPASIDASPCDSGTCSEPDVSPSMSIDLGQQLTALKSPESKPSTESLAHAEKILISTGSGADHMTSNKIQDPWSESTISGPKSLGHESAWSLELPSVRNIVLDEEDLITFD